MALSDPGAARSAPSPYAALVECLSETLVARAARFRDLVVFVSLLALATLVGAIATGSPGTLALLALAAPACALFLVLDARLVDRWRASVLQGWADGEVGLHELREVIGAIPTLPPESVRGMFDALPSAETPPAEREASAVTREATAALARVLRTARRDALVARAAARALAACGVAAAFALWAWPPLLALTLFPLGDAAGALIGRRHYRRARRLVADASARPAFETRRFVRLAESLSWGPLGERRRECLLAAMRRPLASSSAEPGGA